MTIAKKPLSELRRLTKVIRDFATLRLKDQNLPVPQEILDIVRESGAEQGVRLTFTINQATGYPEWMAKPNTPEDAVSNYIENYVLRFDESFVHPMLWVTQPSVLFINRAAIPEMNAIRAQYGYLDITTGTREITHAGEVQISGPRALVDAPSAKTTATVFPDLHIVPGSLIEELEYSGQFQNISEMSVGNPQVWINPEVEAFRGVGLANSVAFPAGVRLFVVKAPVDWKPEEGKTAPEIKEMMLATVKEKAPEAFKTAAEAGNEYKGVAVLFEDSFGYTIGLVVLAGVIDLGRPRSYCFGIRYPHEAISFWTRWLPEREISIYEILKKEADIRGYNRREYLEIATKLFDEKGVIGFACSTTRCFVGVKATDVTEVTGKEPSEIVYQIARRYFTED